MPNQSRSILIINRKILQGAILFKVLVPNVVLVNFFYDECQGY